MQLLSSLFDRLPYNHQTSFSKKTLYIAHTILRYLQISISLGRKCFSHTWIEFDDNCLTKSLSFTRYFVITFKKSLLHLVLSSSFAVGSLKRPTPLVLLLVPHWLNAQLSPGIYISFNLNIISSYMNNQTLYKESNKQHTPYELSSSVSCEMCTVQMTSRQKSVTKG